MRALRYSVLSAALATMIACGSSSSSPAAPSTSTTAPAAAAITVTSFTATAETTGTGVVYHATFQLRETGGRAGATINTVLFTFSNGATANGSPTGAVKIAAGGTFDWPTININDSGHPQVSQLSVAVGFTDDNAHTGSVSGTATVTQLQLVTLAGVVRDSATNAAIGGATVQLTSGASSGKSATADAAGAYSITGIVAGAVTAQASAAGYTSASSSVVLTGDGRVDFKLVKIAAPVEYRITGTARHCSATYENATGGTNQAGVSIPFTYTWPSARAGDFLYMSCQIDTGGDTGSINVAIFKNGTLYKSADAIGFPNIATASGSY